LAAIAILGAQWGDEGKGKVSHLLSQDADFCVRFNGGTNAGHRVIFTKIKVSTAERRGGAVTEEGEFKFHLVPSGALHEHCIGVLGNGMVIDPRALVAEIEALRSIKNEEPQLFISSRAHLLLKNRNSSSARGRICFCLITPSSRSWLGQQVKSGQPARASARPMAIRSSATDSRWPICSLKTSFARSCGAISREKNSYGAGILV